METWVEEIEGWDDRPFSNGYDGLHDLAAADFSGAVSTGGTWLFMVNGRVVTVVQHRQTRTGSEVVDADIEKFEGATGTTYESPHPSIPLLIAMQTRDGETRGRYYSVKTPIDEVAATLADGGFTGYIELSENVLSGDYYSVYQAGRSMDLAFIGNARRLLTGEEAHDRMADEVGIYEVIAVDLDVIDVPGGETSAGVAGAAGAAGGAGAAVGGAATTGDAGEAPTDASDALEGEADGGLDELDEPTTTADPAGDHATASASDHATAHTGDQATTQLETEREEPTAAIERVEEGDDESASEPATTTAPDAATTSVEDTTAEPTPPNEPTETANGNGAATEQLATRSVPSLDPSQSTTETESSAPPTGATEPPTSEPPAESTPAATRTQHADPDEMADLREDLRVAKDELETVRADLTATREERDELAATVESLRARLRELEAGGERGGPSLTAAEAFAGTNLFVRYGSKGKLTVEDAHEGNGDVDDLLANLQLTHHTQFESTGATVDDRPFEEWLHTTQRFTFSKWLATTLLFEIRETDTENELRHLYDALPELDRVEFNGRLTVPDDDGERDVEFDLVIRNQMGDPLVVARLEDARDPVSETSLGTFVQDATATVEATDALAGAFYVTTAFFSPEALETARAATSGSLLSRDRRKSFVKLSRNRGYHLGLVESREESYHLSVPDL